MEERYLLITDVDGTMLGDDAALEEFAAWYQQHGEWLHLVYNSGRLCDSVMRSVESTLLPQPDAIIGGVGSEIRCFRSDMSITPWPAECDGWQPSRITSVLSRYPELEMQPGEFLSEFKISYYAENATAGLINEIKNELSAAKCEVELVYSSNRDLDVLPKGVDKGTAASFLASQWLFPKSRVMVSGDTGNDTAMFGNGFRGIVVANAHDELKCLESSTVYLAKRDHAAGVLEGLTYWKSLDGT